MKMTKHFQTRKNQRGFSDFSLKVILNFGREVNAPGGATKFTFGNREHQLAVGELKRMIQLLDKAKGGKILSINDHFITVYK